VTGSPGRRLSSVVPRHLAEAFDAFELPVITAFTRKWALSS
jgi:hypothetical protein